MSAPGAEHRRPIRGSAARRRAVVVVVITEEGRALAAGRPGSLRHPYPVALVSSLSGVSAEIVLQRRPDPNGDMEIEPGVRVGDVAAAQLADAAEPVPQGAPVDDQRIRRAIVVAT